ncbi:MAG: protein kinase [Endozoicomonadaceae bacterium]|nr:protein kinase [Endozoicomonadaceae bacterium]
MYLRNRLNIRKFKKLRKKFIVTHVLKNARLINTGGFSQILHCQATITKPGTLIKDQTNSKKILESSSVDIAYKVNYDNTSTLANKSSNKNNKETLRLQKYFNCQENKALKALKHSNLIKKVSFRLNDAPATKMVSFKVEPLPKEDIEELQKQDALEDGKPSIEYDFDVVDMPETQPAGIPLELADSSLLEKLQGDNEMPPKEKHNCILSITRALDYMHKNGYAHLDVNPQNILEKDGNWLLADFGTAHHFTDMCKGTKKHMPVYFNKLDSNFMGTVKYSPPEMYARLCHERSLDMILHRYTITNKIIKSCKNNGYLHHLNADAREVDSYSLGLVLYEIIMKQSPTHSIFESCMSILTLESIDSEKVAALYQNHVDTLMNNQETIDKLGPYLDVIRKLLLSDRSMRMNVHEALKKLEEIAEPETVN